ncbi:MAG: TRAP transporter substrate-binding protein [Chloroflexi bacterium]|nr:TRAP transporter substrate-binding protein [Chloroflexota bacterium]
MMGGLVGRPGLAWLVLVATLVVAACAPSAAPQPAAQPAKPAAQPAAPAAQPAAPAAPQPAPAKPAAQAEKPAAAPSKPAAQPQVELRLGTTSTKQSAEGVTGDKFAELVQQKTKGEVLVRVFYQSLGAEQQLAQAVMMGSVDIGNMSNGNSAKFTDAYLVYDLPFLFKDYDGMLRSMDGPVGKKAIAQFEKDTGLKFFMPISLGSGRDIQTTKKQVKVPADLKGLKIRVIASPVDLAIFKAWGANPTPLDFGQLYTALQQGTVEGEGISIGAVLAAKHYEVVKYDLRIDYQALFTQLFMNSKKFESLKPEHQKALVEAAEETKKFEYEYARTELRDRAIRELSSQHGMTIYTPTADEYKQWTAIREKVWQEVADQMKGKIDLNLAKALYEAQ